MISFDEAVEEVRALARPLGTEVVNIDVAAGRVLAGAVIARIDCPRADVAAMDGYAVRDIDLQSLPTRLRIAGKSFAGAGWTGTAQAGECVRIFTGAPVPAGLDRVVIQENVRQEDAGALIEEHPGDARHIRKRASDFGEGDELLPSGRLLDKRAIVAAAAADLAQVEVYRRPRVSILSTGDELAAPGTAHQRSDAIPESVSLGVAAMVVECGADLAQRHRLVDDLAEMTRSAAQAVTAADLVVVTGGASVGEKDFAKAMFEPLAFELIFSKVAIKPGKPVWLGRCHSAFVIGLPGNPTSALVTARLLLAPLLAGLGGRRVDDALQWRTARMGEPLPECGPRETFHRGRWSSGEVEMLGFQDSSAQKALALADVLVRRPANAPATPRGGEVQILDF